MNRRLLSLDVLRGADMLFIMGFGVLIRKICTALGSGDCAFAQQFRHVVWDGLHFEDMIFPLFLFIAGVTFPYSSAKRIENGASRASLVLGVLKRAAILFCLGLLYKGALKHGFADLGITSVLGRIGIAWAAAALVYLFVPLRKRIVLAVATLIGYWLLLRFVGAPDHPDAFPLSPEGNLSGYFDRLLLPGRLTRPGVFANEGTLSTVPAVVTAMLGMFVGEYMRQSSCSESRKTVVLLLSSIVLTALGLGVAFGFGTYSMPLNKILWSSSFVLVVGGYSVALFAIFHWLIDVKGLTGWTGFFRVIGVNSITIYMAQAIVDFHGVSKFFFGGVSKLVPEAWAPVVLQAGYVAACWCFLCFLDRRKIYLKV